MNKSIAKKYNIALILGGALGVYMINSNEWKYYGLSPIGTKAIIKGITSQVVAVLGNGSYDNADLLIYETIGIETHFATAKDRSREYGEGLGQFDKIGFYDTIQRTSEANKKRVYERFGINIEKVKYEDLRKNPTLSILFIRLKYLLVPGAIPTNLEDRYAYYKKWFNSIYGASTYKKYLKANGYEVT